MAAIINKNLKGSDLATKGWSFDFCAFPINKVDCVIVERLLERNKVVFVYQNNEKDELTHVFAVTHKDILNILK